MKLMNHLHYVNTHICEYMAFIYNLFNLILYYMFGKLLEITYDMFRSCFKLIFQYVFQDNF